MNNEQKLLLNLTKRLYDVSQQDSLLDDVVELIRESFGYYYVQIYLTRPLDGTWHATNHNNPRGGKLFLAAGTGAVGQALKAKGFMIPVDAGRSLVAQTARSRKPIFAADTAHHPRHLPHTLLPDTRAEITIPLIHQGSLLGVLDVQLTAAGDISEVTRQTLSLAAMQIAAALAEKDKALHQARLQEHLVAHYQITEVISKAATADEAIAQTIAVVGEACRAHNFGFRSIDPESGSLRTHPSYHKGVGRRRLLTLSSMSEGVAGKVVATGRARYIPDVRQEPAFMGDAEIRSGLYVPVTLRGKVVGIIELQSIRLDAFSDADQKLCITAANQLATALESFRTHEVAARQRIERDALLATIKAISSLQLENVLTTLSQEARRLLQGDVSRIHLLEPDGETLRGVVVLSDTAETLKGFSLKIGQGIAGSVALSGVGEVVKNSADDRRAIFVPDTPRREITAVFAPLKLRQRILGVMSVMRYDVRNPYTQTDLELLVAIADQAAVAIESARLFDAERRKREELSVLHSVAAAGAVATSEEDLLERVTRFISRRLYTESFGVMLLDENSGMLRTHFTYAGPQMTVPVERSLAGRVILTGQPFRTSDVTQHRGLFEADHFEIGAQMRSKLCAPLRIGEELVGVVNAESRREGAFDHTDQHVITTLAQQLATAMARVRLFETERRRAVQQRTLANAAGLILSAWDLHDMWAAISFATRETLQAERTAVYLHAPEDERLVCAFVDGFSPVYAEQFNQQAQQMPSHQLIHRQEPLVINDALTDSLTSGVTHLIVAEGFRSYALFPLRTSKSFVGVLGIYRDQLVPFDDEDVIAGRTLAYIVAVAIQNVQLFAEKQQALDREMRLNEIARILNVERSLPTILATVVRTATELIGADAGVLGLIVNDNVIIHYPHSLPEDIVLHPTPRGSGIEWLIVETETAVCYSDSLPHPAAEEGWTQFAQSFLGVPIVGKDVCLGTLSLARFQTELRFSDRDQALIGSVARQAAIAIQNLRLYEEVQQRVDSLAMSLARQEKLDSLKDAFIQNISHELRTPLGIVFGHAELLESGAMGALQPPQLESVQIITRRARMLTELVEDLSVMLAAQTQDFRREPIHPKQLVDSMMLDFKFQAEAHELKLNAVIEPNLPWISGDTIHLRRVFDNLMSNAFKFTAPGGQVTLRVWRAGMDVIFEVMDTGIGMPEDQIERIFERFYQVELNKHPGGTGLGLALVKEIVEAHQGYVRVESEEGVGSTFEITIPGFEMAAENVGGE